MALPADRDNLPVVIDGGRDMDLMPTFVMSVAQARAQLAQLQEFVRGVMVKGEDYGEIPGTDKPTLLKPGAEKLNEIYGYAPSLEVTHRIEDWEGGFFHYEVRCRLVSKRTGNVIAEGVGSCNSREKRYADRWVFASEIPADVDRSTLKTREFKKRDGSGTFNKYLWANEDIYTLVNTILKMAKKRALVDATLSATRSSGIFTQDMEDISDRQPERPAARQQTPPPRQAQSAVRPQAAPKPAGPDDEPPPPSDEDAPAATPKASQRQDLIDDIRMRTDPKKIDDWWELNYPGTTPETADVETLKPLT
jgi:hypothetical protein